MFDINDRVKFGNIRVIDRYFAHKADKDIKGYDVVCYFYCDTPEKNAKIFNTLYIDLKRTDEEIYGCLSKTNRWIIRKEKRENLIEFEYITNPTDEDIRRYKENFDRFAKAKGIYMCDEKLLTDLKNASKLQIHRALFKGQELFAAAYIRDDKKVSVQYEWNARFWIDRESDPETYKMIGHANKAIEYFSMLRLRDQGIEIYDLCGLTLDENNKESSNIDHRKLSFGGEIVKLYNFMYPLTFKGKMFCLLKKILKK